MGDHIQRAGNSMHLRESRPHQTRRKCPFSCCWHMWVNCRIHNLHVACGRCTMWMSFASHVRWWLVCTLERLFWNAQLHVCLRVCYRNSSVAYDRRKATVSTITNMCSMIFFSPYVPCECVSEQVSISSIDSIHTLHICGVYVWFIVHMHSRGRRAVVRRSLPRSSAHFRQ